MGEKYIVVFNTSPSNCIGSSTNSLTFNINWGAFLDKKYKKFKCSFIFKSVATTTTLNSLGLINANFGKTNIFDGDSMTQNIGFIYPVQQTTTNFFYNSTNNDNNDFLINYPSNNQVNIKLTTLTGENLLASNLNYLLYLSLQGIEE